MEEKLDGERMQLHMRGNGAEWYYCSRKAKDYSELDLMASAEDRRTTLLMEQLICMVRIQVREV